MPFGPMWSLELVMAFSKCGATPSSQSLFIVCLLGRLPKVDLVILDGGKMSVRTSVRPQKVSSISMKFGI